MLCPSTHPCSLSRHTIYGPHFSDRGYNAVQIKGGDSMFVRDVSAPACFRLPSPLSLCGIRAVRQPLGEARCLNPSPSSGSTRPV